MFHQDVENDFLLFSYGELGVQAPSKLSMMAR